MTLFMPLKIQKAGRFILKDWKHLKQHKQTLANAHAHNSSAKTSLTDDEETVMAIPWCRSSPLSGFVGSRGSGWSSKRSEKMKKQNVKRRTGHSGCFPSVTVWQTIISRLCVWEIINFRKTKYVKFIPRASDYFCVFKTGSVERNDILKALCYLLISSHAFYLSCGLKGGALICTQTHRSIYSRAG